MEKNSKPDENKPIENKKENKFIPEERSPNEKRIRQYPAVKIGRLGGDESLHRNGIGSELMDFIKGWVFLEHKPACRLLLLDAYNKERQTNYYIRNGFSFLLEKDETEKTRIMYFDLLTIK